MWECCRYCGSTEARGLVVLGGEQLCPRCAASPLCDICGHPRQAHSGVFRAGGRTCRHLWLDLQSLSKVACDCAGFAPVQGSFRDARFAEEDTDFDLRLA